MNLKVSDYNNGHHIASLTHSEEVLSMMLDMNYQVVYHYDKKLIFEPEKWSVKLSDEEDYIFSTIEDYSVLEFNDGQAYLYYDSSSMDNAIFITNRCNSGCIMCPISEKSRNISDIMDLDILLKICRQIPSDTPHITITGGEPFLLKKDIFVLFDFLKNNLSNTQYLLLTNGRILSNEEYLFSFLSSAPKNITVAIPLHASNKVRHDSITRAIGSFDQTCKAISNLINNDISVEIRIVVSRLNIDEIDPLVTKICKEFSKVNVVNFIGLEMLGSARHYMEDVWISYKDSFKFLEEPIERLIYHGIDTGIYNYPLCCVPRKYWPLCAHSITESKIRYLDKCEKCIKKDSCGGMFFGTFRLLENDVEAIIC
ncbi:His-Xaa-Ser system radical SAM maturase HxsC [Lachnospiraceae bacterium]|nr:His-Xaa-Ser system radical SAM maturase HxsC [Lachnospiraceae bacterium]